LLQSVVLTFFFKNKRSEGTLSEDRIAKLDHIGFDWGKEISQERKNKNDNKSKNEEFWQKMYQRLVKYKEQEGDCNVPTAYDADTSLGHWVDTQRRNTDNMKEHRKELLDAIGFRWGPHDMWEESWMRRYNNFKRILDGAEQIDTFAHHWAERQREEYAKGRMNAKREALLREINFIFDTDQPVEQMWSTVKEDSKREGATESQTNCESTIHDDGCDGVVDDGGDGNDSSLKHHQRKGLFEEGRETGDGDESTKKPDAKASNQVKGQYTLIANRGQTTIDDWESQDACPSGHQDKCKEAPEEPKTAEAQTGTAPYHGRPKGGLGPNGISLPTLGMGLPNVSYEPDGHLNDVPFGNMDVPRIGHGQASLPPPTAPVVPNQGGQALTKSALPTSEKCYVTEASKSREKRKRTNASKSHDRQWMEMYHKLKAFQEANFHGRVPSSGDEANVKLYNWMWYQKRLHSNDSLLPSRETLLNEIGFDWDNYENVPDNPPSGQRWMEMYLKLKEFQEANGHVRVPTTGDETNMKLYGWIRYQRQLHSNGSLLLNRKSLLNAIGFDWDNNEKVPDNPPPSQRWMEMYLKLKAFQEANGHMRVPSTSDGANVKLYSWMWYQRQLHSNGSLLLNRKSLLNVIGFDWDNNNKNIPVKDPPWFEMYLKLKAFQEANGHMRVPSSGDELNLKLYGWIQYQKWLHSNGSLLLNRQSLLNEIGFDWDNNEKVPCKDPPPSKDAPPTTQQQDEIATPMDANQDDSVNDDDYPDQKKNNGGETKAVLQPLFETLCGLIEEQETNPGKITTKYKVALEGMIQELQQNKEAGNNPVEPDLEEQRQETINYSNENVDEATFNDNSVEDNDDMDKYVFSL